MAEEKSIFEEIGEILEPQSQIEQIYGIGSAANDISKSFSQSVS